MTALLTTALITLLLGILYAIAFYWMESKDEDHGTTALAVIFGVSFVGTAFFCLIYIWDGLDQALQYTASLALLFVAAGIPMTVGYYIMRYITKRTPRL